MKNVMRKTALLPPGPIPDRLLADVLAAPNADALPDLLAALKRLLASPMLVGHTAEAEAAYLDCLAAIAKAERSLPPMPQDIGPDDEPFNTSAM